MSVFHSPADGLPHHVTGTFSVKVDSHESILQQSCELTSILKGILGRSNSVSGLMVVQHHDWIGQRHCPKRFKSYHERVDFSSTQTTPRLRSFRASNSVNSHRINHKVFKADAFVFNGSQWTFVSQ
jgi:hypothetical protein